MGEIDIFRSSEDDSESQSIVSQQPSSGVLFKSQNGSTWTPNQFEDLDLCYQQILNLKKLMVL